MIQTLMSLLEVNRLKKSFGRHLAVDEVSFAVGNGEIFGLLGPNGAGKSTTIMMLAGLIKPDSGNIVLDGHTLSHSDRKSRQQMGIVPQDLAIYPNLTARENLRFFADSMDSPALTCEAALPKYCHKPAWQIGRTT